MTNEKLKNVNQCRYCNRELNGLNACNCTKKLTMEKLWRGNIRRRDRIKLTETKPIYKYITKE